MTTGRINQVSIIVLYLYIVTYIDIDIVHSCIVIYTSIHNISRCQLEIDMVIEYHSYYIYMVSYIYTINHILIQCLSWFPHCYYTI